MIAMLKASLWCGSYGVIVALRSRWGEVFTCSAGPHLSPLALEATNSLLSPLSSHLGDCGNILSVYEALEAMVLMGVVMMLVLVEDSGVKSCEKWAGGDKSLSAASQGK
ncbi:hypothetical protein F5B20DRAFT_19013 [Whalleya microplaca]|nr:hypothetical protein F5B20DRAFT_19013 [Whalleya microplaca]